MRVRVMSFGMMRPRLARLFAPNLARVPCLCLLIEVGDELVLVDAGLGTQDIADPARLGFSNVLLNAQRDPELTAVRQLKRLGREPEEVTHIICTHLDRDHAGGLSDFPNALVHVHLDEREAAMKPPSKRERERYRKCHFTYGPKWVTCETVSEGTWFGLDCIRELAGLPQEIVLIPLPGHTRGHCGVAVQADEGWLLHCGDAYYMKYELEGDSPGPFDIRCFRRVAHIDHSMAVLQLGRLRQALKRGNGRIATIASHDRVEFEKLSG